MFRRLHQRQACTRPECGRGRPRTVTRPTESEAASRTLIDDTATIPGAYILLHTLSHLLIQSLAMRCGYPASSILERVYTEDGRYGILLYTGTPDAEGTLGGLVQQGRYVEDHLDEALRMGELCSNDAAFFAAPS